jgi:serine/threonine-protein kinase TNNI3K
MFPFFQRKQVQKQRNSALWNRLDSAALGIARGLEYLHENGVLHGDIKPRNVGFANGVVKLFDLGLARPTESKVLPERFASTPRYASPQIFTNERSPDKRSDVYSFAILLWEIIALKKPFEEICSLDGFEILVVKQGRRLPLKPIPTKRLVSLITRAWSHDPDVRPKMSEVRQVLQDEITSALGTKKFTDTQFESDESTGPTEYSFQSESEQEDATLWATYSEHGC